MSLISVAIAADSSEVAQSPALAQQPSLLASFAPLILIVLVFYFLLIRPQQKKLRAHQEMLTKISKGDKVVTSGGIFGVVVKAAEVNGNYLTIEVADGVRIKVKKDSIMELVNEQSSSEKA